MENNLKETDIKVEYVPFWYRLIISNSKFPLLFSAIIFFIIYFIYSNTLIANIIANSILFINLYLRGFYSTIYYIYLIRYEQDNLCIEYYRFTQKKMLFIPLTELKVEKKRGVTSSGIKPLLCLYQKRNIVLRQHQISKWTNKKIEEVYNEINDFLKEWNENKYD